METTSVLSQCMLVF